MENKCKGTTKVYTSSVKLTEDIWRCNSKKQKEKLLDALNLNKSWAKTKTIKELVERGGGMVANDLKKLNELYLSKKNGEVIINWK